MFQWHGALSTTITTGPPLLSLCSFFIFILIINFPFWTELFPFWTELFTFWTGKGIEKQESKCIKCLLRRVHSGLIWQLIIPSRNKTCTSSYINNNILPVKSRVIWCELQPSLMKNPLFRCLYFRYTINHLKTEGYNKIICIGPLLTYLNFLKKTLFKNIGFSHDDDLKSKLSGNNKKQLAQNK